MNLEDLVKFPLSIKVTFVFSSNSTARPKNGNKKYSQKACLYPFVKKKSKYNITP